MRRSHRRVLQVVRAKEIDDRKIIDALVGEFRPSTVVRMVEELGRHGYLEDTGDRSNNRLNGARCIVWRITDLGRKAAE